MKLIMAVSGNGYVAASEDDDMLWTGPADKAVFRLLTSTSGVLAASAKTLRHMPKELPGRGKLYGLSTDPSRGVPLEDFAAMFPDAWLLGGQELALYAMKNGFVDRAYICRALNSRLVNPVSEPGNGLLADTRIPDKLTGYFARRRYTKGRGSWWDQVMRIQMDESLVEVYERGSAING
jgi:dihydrofolate reductase